MVVFNFIWTTDIIRIFYVCVCVFYMGVLVYNLWISPPGMEVPLGVGTLSFSSSWVSYTTAFYPKRVAERYTNFENSHRRFESKKVKKKNEKSSGKKSKKEWPSVYSCTSKNRHPKCSQYILTTMWELWYILRGTRCIAAPVKIGTQNVHSIFSQQCGNLG